MSIIKSFVNKCMDLEYKTLKDLPAASIMKLTDEYKINHTNILIIDDDHIKLEDTLRRIGYQVSYKQDIEEIDDVNRYSIIICDYKGVGSKFNSQFEGLNLIKLIKEKYPNKIIYLLSAASFNSAVSDYLKYVDESVLKGEEDKIIQYIKEDIEKLFDPIESWKTYKAFLVKKGISEKDIVKLEDLYVRSFIEKKDKLSNNEVFQQVNKNFNVKFDIKVGIINI